MKSDEEIINVYNTFKLTNTMLDKPVNIGIRKGVMDLS